MRVIAPEKIRRARMLRGWTQRTLARVCDRSQQTIHQVENGLRASIAEDLAIALCRELGLNAGDVFADIPAGMLDVIESAPGRTDDGDDLPAAAS